MCKLIRRRNMTVQARKVLDDCKYALEELRKDGIQGPEWRIKWVAIIALLRTVGYVLEKVDTKASQKMHSAINAEWEALKKTEPEPKIYWSFICEERNNILKQYKFGAGQGVTIQVRPLNEVDDSPCPSIYSYPMISGPFAQSDQREIIAEAIKWWENYLDTIDTKANLNQNI